MAEYAGGFGAGFAPGLSQAGGWFSLVPQLREQQARLEERRSREGLTTLKEALDLPSDVRGPYIDHLVQTLGIDPTLGQMFKRAGDETTADIAEVLRVGLEADPVRTARVIQAKGGKEMMVFLSTLSKVKAASAQGTALAGLVGGLEGPATPSGYSFERAETPPVAPPPQAPPGPELLAGPAEAPPTTTGTGTLGGVAGPPPGAAPRPAPIDLRPTGGPTGAFREAYQTKLSTYESEMQRLGDLTRKAMVISRGGLDENTQRFIQSERQRIESQYKPALDSMEKRLGVMEAPRTLRTETKLIRDPVTGKDVLQYFNMDTAEKIGGPIPVPLSAQGPLGQAWRDYDQAARLLGSQHPEVVQLKAAFDAQAEKAKLEPVQTQAAIDTARATLRKINVEIEQGRKPKPTDIAAMRDDFTKASQDFVKMRDAYQKVQVAENTGIGDVARIFLYMKLLDPPSTVREGEKATVEQARGVPATIIAKYNQLLAGDSLDAKQRNDIMSQITRLFGVSVKNQRQLQQYYEGTARRAKMDPEDVIVDVMPPEAATAFPVPGAAPAPSPTSAPVPGAGATRRGPTHEDVRAAQQGVITTGKKFEGAFGELQKALEEQNRRRR